MCSQPTRQQSHWFPGLLLAGIVNPGQAVAQHDALLQLDEIVVTAQKRVQLLQQVPMAVAALTGEALQNAGVVDVQDLTRQVPTLQVQTDTAPVASNYRIRRVGNLGSIPTFEPAVGVFQDGAYRNRPLFSSGELLDIERIEVLRGPQSTLYGKNTTAGVVAFHTRAPGPTIRAHASLDAGLLEGARSVGQYRFVGGISGPLSNTLGGSLGLSWATHGHIDDNALVGSGAAANDLDRKAVRGQLQWQPADALSLRLIAGRLQEQDDRLLPDVHIAAGSGAATAGATLRAFGLSAICTSNDSSDRHLCSRTPAKTELDAHDATLLADFVLESGMTFTSISSWDWFRFKGTIDDVVQLASPLMQFHDTQEARSWQQELRLSSVRGRRGDWLTGVFWYRNEFDRGDGGKRPTLVGDTYSAALVPSLLLQQLFGAPVPVPFATPGQVGIYAAAQDTDYLGIFGQGTWKLTKRFAMTAGLRWQTEKKNASIQQSVSAPGLSLLSASLMVAANSGELSRRTDKLNWSITPQFSVTDEFMLHAIMAHGFKSGGFNVGWGTTPLSRREFADEDVMHYEVGAKGTAWNNRLQFALSAFHTDYRNYQDAAFISQQFTVGNAEKAALRGAEADGKVLLGRHLSADFAISYADFRYRQYRNGLCYPGRTPDNTAAGTCDLSNAQPVNAPKWTTHLGLMHRTSLGSGDVYARTDWSWSDRYNTSYSADPRLVQSGYHWLNLRLGAQRGHVEFVAWIDNALDETVSNLDAQLNLFAADPSYQTFLQAPRSYGLTVRISY
jgi:outer membrane receptor protein involved in Fe transport